MFSKTCEYAIRASLFLAVRSGEVLRTDEVAFAIGAPMHITAKTLQLLVKRSLLSSVKGPHGGFVFEPRHKSVTLHDVIRATDGDMQLTRCFIGLDKCNSKQPCPLHDEFIKVRNRLLKIIDSKTVLQFARQMKKDGTTDFHLLKELRSASEKA